jgi:ribonuclease T
MSDKIATRFRGFLPVVVDVETGGVNPRKDALLEVAAVIITMDEEGKLVPLSSHAEHVVPFEGANIDPEALKINKIDPFHPFRFAKIEHEALSNIFKPIRTAIQAANCQRAVLVGHNSWFDLHFLQAAATRSNIKRNPFHPFTTFDTATLGGLAYGQTVLSRIAQAADMAFDSETAHSARYDAKLTADIFCHIINNAQLDK